MIQVNLLPWREIERAERKQEFLIALGVCALIAALILVPVYFFFEHLISAQQARNKYLNGQITLLEQKISQIKELKLRKQQLLARMNIIQQLQADRTMIVHIYDTLVKMVPDGVYLVDIQKIGSKFIVKGVSDSNQGISKLMRFIDTSEWVTHPVLMEINTEEVNGSRRRNFTLEMHQKVVNSNKTDEEEF